MGRCPDYIHTYIHTYIHSYIHTFIHMYFIALLGNPTAPLARDSSSHPLISNTSPSSHPHHQPSRQVPTTPTPAQVATGNENQPCLPSPFCQRVLAVLAVVILVVALVMVGVFSTSPAYQPLYKLVTSISHRFVLLRNQVQKIVCFNAENVDEVMVNQLRSATNVQLMNTSVFLGLVPRESLMPYSDNRTHLNYTSGSNNTVITNSRLRKWEPFAYMLAGSSVDVTINITVSTMLMPSGSLNEYNDYEKYIQFSQGTTNEPKPYQRFPINTIVGTGITIPIAVHEDGFVLFGVYLLPSSWYLYAYSFHRLYYKSSDYSFDCTLYDKDSLCHLSVAESSHSELCLMAYTQGDDDDPDFVEASYTIVTQELRVFTIAALVIAFVAVVVVVVVIIVCCMVWACRRRRRRPA